LRLDGKDPAYSDGMISSTSSTAIVEGVGMFLMAIYHVIIIIVLVNMLIAMMSHSFEDIQVRELMNYSKNYENFIFINIKIEC